MKVIIHHHNKEEESSLVYSVKEGVPLVISHIMVHQNLVDVK